MSDSLPFAAIGKTETMEPTETTEPGTDPRYDPDCDLCKADRFTHWYHEDDTCWIADCEVCSVPMVVWKPHGTDPTQAEVDHMLSALSQAATSRFGDEAVTLDTNMRQIPEHWHAHARDERWFAERGARPLSRYVSVGSERVERPF